MQVFHVVPCHQRAGLFQQPAHCPPRLRAGLPDSAQSLNRCLPGDAVRLEGICLLKQLDSLDRVGAEYPVNRARIHARLFQQKLQLPHVLALAAFFQLPRKDVGLVAILLCVARLNPGAPAKGVPIAAAAGVHGPLHHAVVPALGLDDVAIVHHKAHMIGPALLAAAGVDAEHEVPRLQPGLAQGRALAHDGVCRHVSADNALHII